MSFSSLPPELVRQVIESTVPRSFHSLTYKARQKNLCRLSLVSHQFRSIAQPLLLEIVWIQDSQDIASVPAKIEGTKGLVSQLVLRVDVYHSQRAVRTIQQFSSLKRLTLGCTGPRRAPVDLTFLGSLIQLSSLHLSLDHWEITGPLVLPTLRSLTLKGVDAETTSVLLNVRNVPNLKQFALVDNIPSSDLLQPLKSSAFRQLVTQLDCLYIDANIWIKQEAKFLRPFATQALIDCAAHELDAIKYGSKIVHLRIYNSFSHESVLESHLQDFYDSLEEYASFIQIGSTIPLQSIYLDDSLRHHVSATPTLDNLARICRERSIELVFEPQFEDYIADCYTSAEFWRRRRSSRSKGDQSHSR